RLNIVFLWSCRNIPCRNIPYGSTTYIGRFVTEQLVALSQSGSREPWNKRKLVGQKAPLRLKEIWAPGECDTASPGRPAAGNDDGFAECSPIFLLADRIHRPQLRQQLVDQRTQPRPRRAVRE